MSAEPRRRGQKPIYRWRTMEVGESFLAPPKFTESSQFSGTLQPAAKRTGRHFSSRLIIHEGQRRVKITRVR